MTLASDYDFLREAINECAGYRILDDEDVLLATDETVCGSLLISDYGYEWTTLSSPDFLFMVGRTVADMNDRKHNDEMDVTERMFRRKHCRYCGDPAHRASDAVCAEDNS